jgi:hypothetical protein
MSGNITPGKLILLPEKNTMKTRFILLKSRSNNCRIHRGTSLITAILSQSQKITKDEKYSKTSPQKYINSKK